MMKPPIPQGRALTALSHAAAEAQLCTLLETGQGERWEALGAYLCALPVETKDHWEFFRCVVLDLAALRQSLEQP